MRQLAAALLLTTIAAVAVAQNKTPSTTVVVVDNNPTAARIIWLDKQTNTRTPVVLNVGQGQTLGQLSVQLTRCISNLGGELNTDTAWLTASEPGRSADWFSGWMINTLPEVATLDHPRYDLQFVGCGSQPRAKGGKVAKSGAMPAEPATDVEAGDDPFAVPGVSDTSPPAAPATESEGIDSETPAAPIAQPVPAATSNTPAEPAPAVEQPAPAESGEQTDLHRMMDGGVY